jgi:hypothetical protein
MAPATVADFPINIAALDHDAREWNRITISSLCLRMIFSKNRFPLSANAALRVRIMR